MSTLRKSGRQTDKRFQTDAAKSRGRGVPLGRAVTQFSAGDPEAIRGSGNIYRDFSIADADVRQLKAILAAEIIRTLDRCELRVRKA